jgi:hypothetical protein
LFAEIEKMVMGDLSLMVQMPLDSQDDKQNQLRS